MSPRASERILVLAGYSRSLLNFRGELLAAMQAEGHHVVAAAPDLIGDPVTSARLRDMGVECRDVPLKRTGLNPIADTRLLSSLVRLLREERPTVLLAYTAKPVIFGMLAAAVANVPRRYALITGLGYAFTDGIAGSGKLVRRILELLYRLALRDVTKAFFQNRDDAALFRQRRLIPLVRPIVIVNGSGVNLREFPLARIPGDRMKFVLIARIIAAKGIREFADAAKLIRHRHPDVEFHLVGGLDSNPDAISAQEISEWCRSGILVWHGEVDDVRPYLAAASVFVLPSYYREGTPRSILEAMATGRPIITADTPGCRDTVEVGRNGYLVPPRSVGALAEAMERLIADPDLVERMGAASREIAETKYDVHQVNAHMLREMELS